jgi:hypothetical protein
VSAAVVREAETMGARWTVNLVLLAVVAVLSYGVHRELARGQRVQTLTELAPDSIAEIRLERPGQEHVALVRETEGWRMESPYRVAADDERIGQLGRIAATQVFRSMPEGDGGSRLGLKPGRALLHLDGLVLRFGDTEPIDQHRYVAIGGLIHLIGDGFQHHLLAPAEDYVSRVLMPDDFVPAAGTLGGKPLDDQALVELGALSAERVVRLGDEISGRLLNLTETQGGRGLRFLVSADGRRWSRLDLRLSYLLSEPPLWALGDD